MLGLARAHAALAAADPGERDARVADLDAIGVGAERLHHADDLVAEREGQLRPELAQLHALAVAEIEVAVVDVQIAVADAGRGDAQQHLGALRRGRGVLAELDRLAPLDDLIAAHVLASPGAAIEPAYASIRIARKSLTLVSVGPVITRSPRPAKNP